MTINPLAESISNLLNTEALSAKEKSLLDTTFADILTESLDNASTTDTGDKTSSLDLLAGTSDDLSGMMVDSQKAEIALSLALSMRNKVLEAYQEIMRMQV